METNKIYLGDAYKLIKGLPDKSVDCIYTDIPYLLDKSGGKKSEISVRSAIKSEELKNISNGIDYKILQDFIRVCKKVNLFIWCSRKQIADIVNFFEGGYSVEYLVWCKTNAIPAGHNTWFSDVEYCLYIRESGVKLNDGYSIKSKWYISPINQKDKRKFEHPTIKPLELVQRHLLHATQPNDIVLDPFVGSGTTAIACKNTGRNYIGFEIEKKWYDIANDRLNGIDKNGQTAMFAY